MKAGPVQIEEYGAGGEAWVLALLAARSVLHVVPESEPGVGSDRAPDPAVGVAVTGRRVTHAESDAWFKQCVEVCRPMRKPCGALLKAISLTAHRLYGEKYWRLKAGRQLLERELRLMGLKVPGILEEHHERT